MAEKKVYTRKTKYFTEYERGLPSQEGKNIVITGTSSGTGLVAAQTALKKGAVVALLNRNQPKAKEAMEAFFAEKEGVEARTHFIQCDLQDFETVKAAAEEVKELFKDGIDVLANNAGVAGLEDKATKDGYDVQMQTNHLSHFLLTKELFPLIQKRAEEVGEARVVNHSSTARLYFTGLKAKFFQKGISGKLGGNGQNMFTGGRWERYHQSKLANSVFTTELQSRCNKANLNVLSLCAHPGAAATGLPDKIAAAGGQGQKNIDRVKGMSQTVQDGTLGLARCMFDKKVEKGAMYGPMFMTGKATKRFHGLATTSKAGKLLWKESEEACGKFIVGSL